METKPVEGIRFIAQGDFVGANRSFGPRINAWIKPTGDDKKEYKIKVNVINLHGDTIRTYTTKEKEGLRVLGWNMRRDGVRFPGSKVPKADDDKPSGIEVPEGVYKMLFELNKVKDSCLVEVKLDPRIDVSTTNLRAQRNDRINHESLVTECTESYDMLINAEENIERVTKIMKLNIDSLPAEWKDLHKELTKDIDSLKNVYRMPDDLKGIQRNPNTVVSKLYSVYSYLGYPNTKSTNVQNQFDQARKFVTKANEGVKSFIENKYNAYEEKVKSTNFGILKEMKKE
jgi:hypothetical protein